MNENENEHAPDPAEGPEFPDGPEFEGFDGRTGLDGSEIDSAFDTESEVAGEIASDEDGYLVPPAEEADPETIVVHDFDPTDPGAPLDEPVKVLKPHDRIARKAAQRANLDKSSLAEAPSAEGEDLGDDEV